MTTLIVYNAGAYGTYLEWVLTSITSQSEVKAPFTKKGTSHNFFGNHLLTMDDIDTKISMVSQRLFARVHPKNKQTDILDNSLNYLCNCQDLNVVYLYPSKDQVVFMLNNFYYKSVDCWWTHTFSQTEFKDKILSNWPVDQNFSFAELPVWVQREFLSFYLVPAWYDQVEWYHLDRWQHPNATVVLVGDLLYNFENTVTALAKKLNLNFHHSLETFLGYHDTMLKLQQYSQQDSVCQQVVDSTIDGKDYCFGILPLPSQAWIQWQLRNLGYEIKCHGLDTFPTNSIQLRELLYPI